MQLRKSLYSLTLTPSERLETSRLFRTHMGKKNWVQRSGRLIAPIAIGLFATTGYTFAQSGHFAPPDLAVGEKVWKSGCISCHGADGKGTPTEIAGFQQPNTFPDFSRCDQTTAETDLAYKDVIMH